MHIRIGGPDASLIGALREGGANRTRTPVPEPGGDDAGANAGAGSGVVIRLSPEARQQMAEQSDTSADTAAAPGHANATATATAPDGEIGGAQGGEETAVGATGAKAAQDNGPAKPLSSDEKAVVQKLQARDTAVRAHEAAHMAAAKGLGGGASYTYETGPDGRRYAVGGEVPIQLASGNTPDETIQNAETVRAAALAPADPSSQDLAVAAQASQMEAAARQEKAAQQRAAASASADHRSGVAAPDAQNSAAPRSTDPTHDSLMVFSAIKSERPQAHGGVAHMHSGGDCAFCKRAASKYAS